MKTSDNDAAHDLDHSSHRAEFAAPDEHSSARSTPDVPGEPRSPHVGPHCANCDRITLVSPCTRPGCLGWAIVCQGCPDVVDRFVASGGLCEACRAG